MPVVPPHWTDAQIKRALHAPLTPAEFDRFMATGILPGHVMAAAAKEPPFIHWPLGIVSKLYVALLLFGALGTLFMGMNGGLPEKTPDQRRSTYERFIEPMFR